MMVTKPGGPEALAGVIIAEKKLDPLVSVTLPLAEARQAMARLLAGTVEGKIVLTA